MPSFSKTVMSGISYEHAQSILKDFRVYLLEKQQNAFLLDNSDLIKELTLYKTPSLSQDTSAGIIISNKQLYIKFHQFRKNYVDYAVVPQATRVLEHFVQYLQENDKTEFLTGDNHIDNEFMEMDEVPSASLRNTKRFIFISEPLHEEYLLFKDTTVYKRVFAHENRILKLQNIQETFNNRISDLPFNVCEVLTQIQHEFFGKLRDELDKETPSTETIDALIGQFYRDCKKQANEANQVMGLGWMHRVCEVVIKAIGALFAGIGMVVGSIFSQGFADETHRNWYRNTFFTWDKSSIEVFKENTVGTDETPSTLMMDITNTCNI